LNPRLNNLQQYPFERLRALLAGVTPNPALAPCNLSIGEPKHATPQFIRDALTGALAGLSTYPPTAGSERLRSTIAGWLSRRHGLSGLDPTTQVLPINGSREALFALAQVVVDPDQRARGAPAPVVISPNPFYQIYEGAAILAGAEPYYVAQEPEHGFRCDWRAIPEDVLARTQLLYVCSPGNPTGAVMDLDEWRTLFELSDRHGFVIASDECYSEIYFDESRPPLGALSASQTLGRTGFSRLVVFGSLSKRSNCPGMRSGYVAGDARLMKSFLLYRTYHGSAMSDVVQAASIAAWEDEAHVRENRSQYRAKFDAIAPRMGKVLQTARPEAGFYLWAGVPGGDDAGFVRELYRQYNVLALPGSYLAREYGGRNPGRGFVRFALVEPLETCVEGCRRIESFITYNNGIPA
jgi:N-succinyldiaminopimelate aminotransferase